MDRRIVYNFSRMGKFCLRIVSIVCLCISLCGCETVSSTVSNWFSEPEPTIDPTMFAIYDDGIPRIKVGVGLVVQVGVAGQKSQLMECMVDQNGQITLPYLLTQAIKCDGFTLDELRRALEASYKEFIRQPQVTVSFAQFDTQTGVSPYGTVMVLGEVGKPGPVNMPPTMDLTILKALQAAGWFRPFANKENVQVTRCRKDGTFAKFIVDINEIGKEGRIDKDMKLRAGDVIWVRETYF